MNDLALLESVFIRIKLYCSLFLGEPAGELPADREAGVVRAPVRRIVDGRAETCRCRPVVVDGLAEPEGVHLGLRGEVSRVLDTAAETSIGIVTGAVF